MINFLNQYQELSRPVLFYKDKIIAFYPSKDTEVIHYFGGDLNQNNVVGDAQLHQLFTISLDKIECLKATKLTKLSLPYPFFYDGAEIEYDLQSDGSIRLIALKPNYISEDWLYDNYPSTFKQVNFSKIEVNEFSLEELQEIIPQYLDVQDNELVFLVPPSEDYRVSLWGEYGDPENVTCVFKVNIDTGKVFALNQCT